MSLDPGILYCVSYNDVYDVVPVPGKDMDHGKQKNVYVMHPYDSLPTINVL